MHRPAGTLKNMKPMNTVMNIIICCCILVCSSVAAGCRSYAERLRKLPVDLPELESMPARWDAYLDSPGTDLTGYDRARIRGLGHEYLSAAVEGADEK